MRSPTRALAPFAVTLMVALGGAARADVRCAGELQRDVCLGADLDCPATAGPVGPAAGSWVSYQGNPQHTGATEQLGPTCGNLRWETKLEGKVFSPAVLAEPQPGAPEVLFVPVGKEPACGLDPQTGAVLWCGTNERGKLVDRSAPTVGNGDLVYVGTRDNDLWAFHAPPIGQSFGTVAWRQKVCTDGDVTTPPTIGPDGTVYMGSDSLGAGTIMAMCPGPERQVKWCHNPIGGGVRNTSPALSPSGHRVYVMVGKTTLTAYDTATGEEAWRLLLEPKRAVPRAPNYSPVVDPVTGRIYVGLDKGLWAIDVTTHPQTGAEQPAATLLYATGGEKMYSPPVLDRARGRLVFGASRGVRSSLYAVSLDGALLWKRSGLPRGRFRNNPPVVDGAGRIYLTLGREALGLSPTGDVLWRHASRAPLQTSVIVAGGNVYVGSANATVYAIGGCAP